MTQEGDFGFETTPTPKFEARRLTFGERVSQRATLPIATKRPWHVDSSSGSRSREHLVHLTET